VIRIARAYAVQPFMWSLGSILGSALGGFLAQPARYYPKIFPPDGLFGKFPYLLPNLVAAGAIVAAILQGYFLLKETNPRFQSPPSTEEGQAPETAEVADERTPLFRITSHGSTLPPSISQGRRPSFISSSNPTILEPSFDLRRSSIGTIHSITITSLREQRRSISRLPPVSSSPPTEEEEGEEKAFNYSVIMLTIALILMCYHQMGFASLLPIYLLDDPHYNSETTKLDLYGGLGYTVHDVGIYMSVNGAVALLIQALIFPFFVERVGVWRSFVYFTIFYPITYILMPFLTLLPSGAALQVGVYASLFLQNFCAIIFFPCALILLKNAAPSPLVLGKVNGLAMSACSGARTVAPPLAGIIYSALGSAAAWWSCGIFAIVAIVQLYWIPKEKVAGVVVDKVVENVLRRKSNVEGVQGLSVVEDEEQGGR
jgi:MFS family permease